MRFALGLLLLSCGALAAPGYYRHPAVHGDTVVFTAEGDLWRVPLAGGVAQRLTSHAAEETQAAISPDGKTLAFVAGYDGGSDIYAMPVAGGAPTRLSFDGARVYVQGFSPKGEVVYATENTAGPTARRVLRLVDPGSGATRELPLADANEAAFDPESDTLWFTRFGLHLSGDNARQYRGGAMAQLWRWSGDETQEAQRLAAQFDANLTRPMYWQGRLYAISDKDGVANLWSLAPDGSDPKPLTAHREFEVRQARMNGGRIVYQNGADLRVFDLASGEDRLIPIELNSDRLPRRERYLKKPLDYLDTAHLGGGGKRVAVTARGHVAVAGPGPQRRVEIAADPRARLRAAVLSPDDKFVYAITDLDGRSEIWRYPADGAPGGKKLVDDAGVHRWRLYLSPDGRWLAYDDKRGQLWLLDLEQGTSRVLDRALDGDDAYAGVRWSPDSRYVALVRSDSPALRGQVLLHEIAGGKQQTLTSDRYESFAPAFSRDGKWLYFLSDRTFQSTVPSPWGDRNTGAFFDKRTKVYALALQRGLRFPFLPTDELAPKDDDAKEENGNGDKSEKKDTSGDDKKALPAVQWEGLRERLYEVPLEASNYRALALDDKRLYLLDSAAGADAKPLLETLAIDAQQPKPEQFLVDVLGFQLSTDAKQLFIIKATSAAPGAPASPGEMLIVPAGSKMPDDTSKASVRLGDWALVLRPEDEWRQMFDDAWRLHRDFSFDPGMRGVDWAAVRARYAPLLPRVGDRAELSDLLAQMSGELGILHSQVGGGELRADPDAPAPASLGAVLRAAEGGVKIEHIYRTEAELPNERSPLQQPNVDAREGDLILAINGAPVRTPGEVAARLRQQAGQQVLLSLRRGEATHRTVVQPVALGRDAELRYGDWVQGNRARVEAGSGGKLGYLHLRAMGARDIAGFAREFYANFDREGLVLDVRRNRGGNIDSWVIEKLLRRAWAFWQPAVGRPYANMQQSFRGHLVVLADALTYSDGETFTAGIKALGLGPVIGTRTSGAGIWLTDRNTLADSGIARIAEFGQFDPEGRWLIEGRGVTPDVEVDNLPVATAKGGDAQLDAAIAHLQRRLKEAPIAPLKAQPIPARGTPGHDGSR